MIRNRWGRVWEEFDAVRVQSFMPATAWSLETPEGAGLCGLYTGEVTERWIAMDWTVNDLGS